jgi:hypothetical protein
MKFLFTLLSALLILGVQDVMSQSFEFLPNDTIRKDSTLPEYQSVLEINGHVKNTGNAPLTLKWKRVTNSGTQSITQSFCDNTNCYSNNFIAGVKIMDPIAAGDSGIMRLDLEAKCNAVSARVQVLVWVDGDSASTAKTITFLSTVSSTVNCLATGIDEAGASASVQIFPNPATEFITVKFNQANTINAVVTDINGRIVKEVVVKSNERVNISDLGTGLYFLKPEQGIFKSFRFIKF